MMMLFGFLPIILVALGFSAFRGARRTQRQQEIRSGKHEQHGHDHIQIDGSLFRLAKCRGGKLTLSDVVIETGMELKKAERYMDSIVDHSRVSMEVEDSGRLIYVFPELLENQEIDDE